MTTDICMIQWRNTTMGIPVTPYGYCCQHGTHEESCFSTVEEINARFAARRRAR